MNTISEIQGCGSYLPKNFITNDELAEIIDTSDEWITTRTGIKQRHSVGDQKLGPADLAVKSTEKLLKKTNLQFLDVKILVSKSEIIFVPIQTPHDKKYEGVSRRFSCMF